MVWMLLALLMQTLTLVSPYGVVQRADDVINAVGHVKQIDHHHHDDFSLHADETHAVQTHHHAPSGLQTPGLVRHAPAQPDIAASIPPQAGNTPLYVQPWIDGWLRPPKSLA